MNEIYINGYPRSGTAWLTRLLNDILSQEGYVIRRGHFALRGGKLGTGRFYELDDLTGDREDPKELDPSGITDEKIIFLVRDPRDICVSGAWLWRQPVERFLDRMIKGDVVRCGRWDEYCNAYLEQFTWYNGVKYEDLLNDTARTIRYLLDYFVIRDVNQNHLMATINRQSFPTLKKRIGNDEQALRRAGLRKGIAGDWRNHFTGGMNDKIWSEFGWMMERLGYER